MRCKLGVLLLLSFSAVVGCGGGEGKPKIVDTIPPEMMSASPANLNLAPEPVIPGNVVASPGDEGPAVSPANGEASIAPSEVTVPLEAAPVATERVVAEQGVGIKGRSLDEFEGAVVTPAKAFFSVRERVVFEIAVPQALNLYKATNGEGPKSHEEFMAQIVEANQIQLPELPATHKYVYDPATEQLMVERPKQ